MHTSNAAAASSAVLASAGRSRRRFSLEDRRRALVVVGECGGNLTKAAARLGLGVPLLSKWRAEAIRAAAANARTQTGR
jgi:transposase-like protein